MRVFERLRRDDREQESTRPAPPFDWALFAIAFVGTTMIIEALRAGHWITPLLGLCVLVFAVSVQSRQLLLVVSGYLLHG